MQVNIGIPTVVNPTGLARLIRLLDAHTQRDYYKLTVLLDGNRDWLRLDQMPEYRDRFHTLTMSDDPETDHQRITRFNPDVGDYSFLAARPDIEVIRNEQRLGVTGAWNRLVQHMLGSGLDYFVIMNDDLLPQPGWLNYLLAAANKYYPNGLFFGYASGGTACHPGPSWPGLSDTNFWGPCQFLRAAHVRTMMGDRGWLYNPEFKLFYSDGYFIHEVLNKGFDVVSIADPCLIQADWHRSLGHWVLREAQADTEKHHAGLYPPAQNGRFFTYVRMNEAFEVVDEKKL